MLRRSWIGSRIGRPLRCVGFVLALALWLAPDTALSSKLVVDRTVMKGFGRIVLSFDTATKTTARISNSILILSFSEPVTLQSEKLAAQLPPYVSVARLDPDRRGLRLGLVKPIRFNLMEAGEKIFIDLLPANWAGLLPGLPQDVVDELARRAQIADGLLRDQERARPKEEPKQITFRIGSLPTLTRVVFSPPKAVPVAFTRDDDRAILDFSGAVAVDKARLKAALPPSVLGIETSGDQSSLRLVLAVAPDIAVQGFREDDDYVVDIAKPSDKKAKGEAGDAPVEGTGAKTKARAKVSAEAAPEKAAAEKSSAKSQNEPAKLDASGAPEKAPIDVSPADKRLDLAPVRVGNGAASAENGKSLDIADAPQGAALVPLGPVRAHVEVFGAGLKITFPFQSRTAAAAFERDGAVTVVFETAETLDRNAFSTLSGSAIVSAEATRRGTINILRLKMAQRMFTRLSPLGQGWVLTLGDDSIGDIQPLAVERAGDGKGKASVEISIKDTAGIHWVEGATSDERIAVVTAFAPARGLVKPQRFVELEALQSVQGIAILALADDLTVKAGVERITVGRPSGLFVSVTTEPELEGERPSPLGTGTTFVIDRATWLADQAGVLRDRERQLAAVAAAARPSDRNEARFVYARFLSANKLAVEARGVLEALAADDPKRAAERPVALLRAIVAYQLNRFSDARALLTAPILADDPEAVLWRAAVDARTLRWREALVGFRRSVDVLDAYPEHLQAELRTLAVRAALALNEVDYADRELDLAAHLPDTVSNDQIALLRARLDEGSGKFDDALATYQSVADDGERPLAAEATLYAAQLALKRKAINAEQAIAKLEALSVIWRGDEIEAKTLGLLGQLYAETGQWRQAFLATRTADQYFTDHPVTRALHEEMARRFEELFLSDQSSSLGRLDSLALYYDFKEFTPIGRHGDEIIRRLADRLTELDLLEQAGDLLQHQVDNRLSGAARATVAAKLASLRLMDGKPAQALSTLQETRLPKEIKRARLLLEARALSDLSRTDLALELLAEESGPEISRLKADILWQARRWREAGEAHEVMLDDRWQGPEPLTDGERNDVMRAGIAYALASEALSLDRLKTKYVAKMANSVDGRTFAFLTGPSARGTQTFRDMARVAVNTDTLSDFLTEFRKRYPNASVAPRARGAKPVADQKQVGSQ